MQCNVIAQLHELLQLVPILRHVDVWREWYRCQSGSASPCFLVCWCYDGAETLLEEFRDETGNETNVTMFVTYHDDKPRKQELRMDLRDSSYRVWPLYSW